MPLVGGGRGQVVEAKLRAVLTDPWARQGGPENIVVERQQTCSEIYSLTGVLLI